MFFLPNVWKIIFVLMEWRVIQYACIYNFQYRIHLVFGLHEMYGYFIDFNLRHIISSDLQLKYVFFIHFDLVINRCQSKYTNMSIFYASKPIRYNIQVTATDGDKDRPQNIVYFLTGQGIDPDNPANSKFDINRTTGEIFVLKVSAI